jgi:hypothetical protein
MKDIKNYEGLYQISCCGDILSLRKKRILTPKISRCGYHTIGLRNSGRKWFTIHRLVASAFIPNPLNLPQVNHIDGNKLNNHVLNLEWCTSKENIRHAHKTGLSRGKKGTEHPMHKLTEQQVLEIRSKYIPRLYSCSMLGKEYSIDPNEINLIIRRKIWKHI